MVRGFKPAQPGSPARQVVLGGSPNGWTSQPWAWVLFQALVVWLYFDRSGQLDPVRHVDSGFYLSLAKKATLVEMLGSLRSLGYPIFLKLVRAVFGDLTWLAHLQVLLFGAATITWTAALCRFGLSKPAALLAGSAPLYSPLFFELKASVMTDLPAGALALFTCAALLLLLAEPSRKRWWLAVGVALPLAYHLRPSYLVLLPLAPALAWVMRRGRLAWGLGALVAGPLLLFCVLRWGRVGHFGLTAFTGHNLVGLAASMLSPELVAELPARDRPLAAAIFAERTARGLAPLDGRAEAEAWIRDYNWNIWNNAVRLARRDWRREFDRLAERGSAVGTALEFRDVYVEKRLLSLSLAVLRARPGLYAAWLARGAGQTLLATAKRLWVVVPAVLLAASAWFWRRRRSGTEPNSQVQCCRWVLILAAGYWLVSLALVLLVEIPASRYLAAAELLLPGAMLAMVVELGRAKLGR